MAKEIKWKLHLNSPPSRVFELISTDEGRSSFWAEESHEYDGKIEFRFPNGQKYLFNILTTTPDAIYSLEYFYSTVTFYLIQDAHGGTDLTIINKEVTDEEYLDSYAGWISVLLNLKSVADHNIDLRNHDELRTWQQGYVDN